MMLLRNNSPRRKQLERLVRQCNLTTKTKYTTIPKTLNVNMKPVLTAFAAYGMYKMIPTSNCEAQLQPVVLMTPPPTPLQEKEIPKSMKQRLYDTFSAMVEFSRYVERLLMYAIFGLPLVGLLPASYGFRSVYPPIETFTWEYLLWAVHQLGPCFIKLAQWASTRPDLFPPNLVEKLISLQDDVAVHYSFAEVEETMKTAFGPDWKEIIAVDPKALGSGCVAQVFKGKLKTPNGGDAAVAVKMIHPHVERQIKTDMNILSAVARFIDCFPSLEILSLGETCRQFAESMNRQLDLRVEASNLVKFAKKFSHDTWAVFPQPIEGFVAKNVLVETLMDGSPISRFMDLPAKIGDKTYDLKMKLSDLGARLVIKMVFFDNLIHGDLHPGNILVQIQPNGEPRLVVLDCGIVYAAKTEEEFDKLVNICYSFMKHDGRGAARYMVEKAKLDKNHGVKNEEEFMDSIQKMVDDSLQQSYFEHLGEYTGKICTLARNHMVRLDPTYFQIAMSLKVAEGISLALNNELDMISKCLPIVLKARSLRAMGITQFPKPEDDETRTLNLLPNYKNSNYRQQYDKKN